MLLLLAELALVELQLLTFKNVAVSAAGLAGAGGNACQQAALVELIKQCSIGGLGSSCKLGKNVLALLGGLTLVLGGGLLANRGVVVLLIPLSEGGCIDLDDGALHQGLGADQLVVGCVVDNIQDTSLAGDGYE